MNSSIKLKYQVYDVSELFQLLRKLLEEYPKPCFCIRRSIESSEFFSILLGLKPYFVKYRNQMKLFWENWVDERTIRTEWDKPKTNLLEINLPEETLLDLYLNKNLTLNKIAQKYNVSYSTLRRYMRKIGIGAQ